MSSFISVSGWWWRCRPRFLNRCITGYAPEANRAAHVSKRPDCGWRHDYGRDKLKKKVDPVPRVDSTRADREVINLDVENRVKNIGDTGLEPTKRPGHAVDTPSPSNTQVGSAAQVKAGTSGHAGTNTGHPKDASVASPCCAGVAQKTPETMSMAPDLEKIIGAWPSLPLYVREAIMALVKTAK